MGKQLPRTIEGTEVLGKQRRVRWQRSREDMGETDFGEHSFAGERWFRGRSTYGKDGQQLG
jgi:hypothetical protein